MFITTLQELARLLAYAFLLGVAFGLLYDLFRIVKVAVLGSAGKHRDPQKPKKTELPGFFLHFFTDLLFFAIAAIVTVIFLYAYHRGKVRISAIFSEAAGFFTYYFTVGRLVYSLAEWIVATVRKALRFVLRFVYTHTLLPISATVKKLFRRLYTALRTRLLRTRRIAESGREEEKFLHFAQQGFGIAEERVLKL